MYRRNTYSRYAYVSRIRTLGNYVRNGKYVRRGRRTSVEYVHQYNAYVAESRSSPEHVHQEHVHQEYTYARASPEGARRRNVYHQDTYARMCTRDCRTPNLHHHGRSWNTMSLLRSKTDLETFTKTAYNRPCSKRPSFRFRNAEANRRTQRKYRK